MKTSFIIKKIPEDLKNSIKDCLLSVMWKKNDLTSALKNCNFNQKDLSGLNNQHSKSEIIDIAFNNLSCREDRGATQMKSVIEMLINWSDFESYYWNNGTLKKEQALKKIDNLKKILAKKTEQDQELQNKKEREEKIKKEQQKPKLLLDLNKRFLELCKMYELSQKRGYELEKLLHDIFVFFEIDVCKAFKLAGEQIDGSFNFKNQNYIFEAKWQSTSDAVNSLYTFAYKIESNTMYPRGVFFSISGYSEESIQIITKNKKPSLILIDSADLIAVLEGRITMSDLLSKKIEYAQTRGNIYVNIYQLIKNS
jgi:hypothetical protein